MDEMPLWIDMPGDTTIARTGVKSVPLLTSGHEKNRFTVCLAAMAGGEKLKPFVVFKRVRQDLKLVNYPGVVVTYSRNGWMSEHTTRIWIEKVWGTLSFQRRLLIWDAYKCHLRLQLQIPDLIHQSYQVVSLSTCSQLMYHGTSPLKNSTKPSMKKGLLQVRRHTQLVET